MPRKTHKLPPEENIEKINSLIHLDVGNALKKFLELEAKMQTEKLGQHITVQDIIRALITAYYEKKMAGLLVNPDD